MRVNTIVQCMLCATFIRWRLIFAKSVIKGRNSNMGFFLRCRTCRVEFTRRCKNLVVAIRSTNDELNHRDPGSKGCVERYARAWSLSFSPQAASRSREVERLRV